ncbi:MAG: hypothetical protein HY516_00855 [Candidatus Aenigmarchaeota archaeon]|nr:hypothetical protein [Candidatus Aenigmarchaeota archaeon]
MKYLRTKKAASSVVSSVMLVMGTVILVGLAYAWFNGTLGFIFNGGLYPQVESFCTGTCTIDAGKFSKILVPLDAISTIRAKVINTAATGKTYAIAYYPNFTSELSLIAATPTIFVPASSTGFAEVSARGLIVRNNDVSFNITAVNVNDNKDNMSFGITSSVNTANVPEISAAWFLIILFAASSAVYLKSR